MKLFVPFFALQLLSWNAFAESGCEMKFHKKELFEIRVNPDCRVEVFPRNGGTRRRSFSFYPNGFFMTFVDTQDYDRNSKATGSRTFYLFPVSSRKPAVKETADGGIEVLTAAGTHVKVGKTGQIETINGGSVKLTPLRHMDQIARERGGIEITGVNGVVLDHGWNTGGVAYRYLDRSSVLRDQRGHSCTVKNSEMYSPNKRDPSDPIKKFATPGEWKSFVTKKCKNLKWTDEPYIRDFRKTNPSNDPVGDLINRLENQDAR